MCAIKRIKKKRKKKKMKNIKKHAHKNRYTNTCYNITSVQLIKDQHVKKKFRAQKHHSSAGTSKHKNTKRIYTRKSHSCICNGWDRHVENAHGDGGTETLNMLTKLYTYQLKKRKEKKCFRISTIFNNQYFLPTSLFKRQKKHELRHNVFKQLLSNWCWFTNPFPLKTNKRK